MIQPMTEKVASSSLGLWYRLIDVVDHSRDACFLEDLHHSPGLIILSFHNKNVYDLTQCLYSKFFLQLQHDVVDHCQTSWSYQKIVNI